MCGQSVVKLDKYLMFVVDVHMVNFEMDYWSSAVGTTEIKLLKILKNFTPHHLYHSQFCNVILPEFSKCCVEISPRCCCERPKTHSLTFHTVRLRCTNLDVRLSYLRCWP